MVGQVKAINERDMTVHAANTLGVTDGDVVDRRQSLEAMRQVASRHHEPEFGHGLEQSGPPADAAGVLATLQGMVPVAAPDQARPRQYADQLLDCVSCLVDVPQTDPRRSVPT